MNGERDNIVIKGETETQILKIKDIVKSPMTGRDARILARRLLMQEEAQERASALVERLNTESTIRYFNAAFAPVPESQ